jgi:hypothetical protein
MFANNFPGISIRCRAPVFYFNSKMVCDRRSVHHATWPPVKLQSALTPLDRSVGHPKRTHFPWGTVKYVTASRYCANRFTATIGDEILTRIPPQPCGGMGAGAIGLDCVAMGTSLDMPGRYTITPAARNVKSTAAANQYAVAFIALSSSRLDSRC